MVRKGN